MKDIKNLDLLTQLAAIQGLPAYAPGMTVKVDSTTDRVWNPLENDIDTMAVRLRAGVEVTTDQLKAVAKRLKFDYAANPRAVLRRVICLISLEANTESVAA